MFKIIVFSILFISSFFNRNENIYKSSILNQGLLMSEAISAKDFDTFIKYKHPKIIEISGGKLKFKEYLNKSVGVKSELQYLEIELGEPGENYKLGNEIQCLVPEKTTFKIQSGGKMIAESFFIAISKNNGLNWVFIETGPGLSNLRKILPLSDKLKFDSEVKRTMVHD